MSTVEAWAKFLSHSLATRLDFETFESYVQLLSTKHPLPSDRISDLFLRPTDTNNASLDPRIPRYVQIMIGLELVTLPSVLKALSKHSTVGTLGDTEQATGEDEEKQGENGQQEEGRKRLEKEKGNRWTNSYSAEEMLFYRLAKHISAGSAPRNSQEAVELVLVCIQWMELVISAGHNGVHEMLGLGGAHTEELGAEAMALGTLVVAAVENGQVLRALGKGSVPKGTGKQLSKALAKFVPLLLQSSPQSAARLELFRTQTLVAIEPVDKKEMAAHKEIDELLDGNMELGIDSIVVADLPNMNSRAGLYIYLNSLVSI